jgi:hypothetical protein
MRGFGNKTLERASDETAAQQFANVRATPRYAFNSAPFRIRLGGKAMQITLKDLSAGGACGLISEPVSVGDHMVVELDARHQIEAQVRWVRRLLVGLRFTRPLTQTFVESLHARRETAQALARVD